MLTGFGDDASAWLADLLVPGRSADTLVSLDQKQLPVQAVPAALIHEREPVLTTERLQRLLAGRAEDSQRDLRGRADDLARRIADLQARRRDLAGHRARLDAQLDAAIRLPEHDPELVDVFLDAEANALADELASLEQEIELARPRDLVRSELDKWERVLAEAQARLAHCRDTAPSIDPVDIAEATRLRNEWRYAEQSAQSVRRRRPRREADEHRDRYEAFLARFGANCFEDLSVVGTGFGNTEADIAIREAATVVSMAEQQCAALRSELDVPSPDALANRKATVLARAAVLLGRAPGADAVGELRSLQETRAVAVDDSPPEDLDDLRQRIDRADQEFHHVNVDLQTLERESGAIERARLELADRATKGLSSLGPVAVEALLGRALADRRGAGATRPLVVDDILRSLAPRSRRRAFDVLAGLSRSRQVVLVSDSDDVALWAAELNAEDVLVWTAQQAAEACA